MRELRKWNGVTYKYEIHYVPEKWNVTKYTSLNSDCNCASCGKKIEYRQSHRSLTIYDIIGNGFAICEDCHGRELKTLNDKQQSKRSGRRKGTRKHS